MAAYWVSHPNGIQSWDDCPIYGGECNTPHDGYIPSHTCGTVIGTCDWDCHGNAYIEVEWDNGVQTVVQEQDLYPDGCL